MNHPQTTETLVIAHIDEDGKQHTVSRVIHSEHPTMATTDISYEEARTLAYQDIEKLKEEQQ